MNTNGKEDTKTITYNPKKSEIIREIQLEEDYGFQLVKFDNNIYGVNYINPVKNINETVMIGVDAGVNLGPLSFLKYAELAYGKETHIDIADADRVELCVILDQENKEIYRETINGDEAKTLLEKMDIAREIVEMKTEDDFWLNHGTNVIMVCVLINIVLVFVNLINLMGGILE